MLAKLNLKHKHPKTDNVKLHPGTACKSMFYHSLEPVEGIKNEEDRKESTVRSGDEEQPTRSSETKDGNEAVEEVKELPEAFPKWEMKSLLPDSLSIEIQITKLSRQPRESESLGDKKSNGWKSMWLELHYYLTINIKKCLHTHLTSLCPQIKWTLQDGAEA